MQGRDHVHLHRRQAITAILGGLAGIPVLNRALGDGPMLDHSTLPYRIDSTNGFDFAAATVHPLATRAAKNAFASGGSASICDGVVDSQASKIGALASGVPSQVHALARLSQSHGRIGWAGGLREAAGVAREGYAVGIATHSAIARVVNKLHEFPASRAVLNR